MSLLTTDSIWLRGKQTAEVQRSNKVTYNCTNSSGSKNSSGSVSTIFSLDYPITMLMSKHQLRNFIHHSKLFEKVAHTFSDTTKFNPEAYYGKRHSVQKGPDMSIPINTNCSNRKACVRNITSLLWIRSQLRVYPNKGADCYFTATVLTQKHTENTLQTQHPGQRRVEGSIPETPFFQGRNKFCTALLNFIKILYFFFLFVLVFPWPTLNN